MRVESRRHDNDAVAMALCTFPLIASQRRRRVARMGSAPEPATSLFEKTSSSRLKGIRYYTEKLD